MTMQLETDLDDQKRAYETGESVHLKMSFNTEKISLEKTSVTAILTRKNDIDGFPLPQEDIQVVELKQTANNTFSYTAEGLKAGVYNVVVNAQDEKFARSLVSGFVVKAAPNDDIANIDLANQLSLTAYPNPIQSQTNLTFTIQRKSRKLHQLTRCLWSLGETN